MFFKSAQCWKRHRKPLNQVQKPWVDPCFEGQCGRATSVALPRDARKMARVNQSTARVKCALRRLGGGASTGPCIPESATACTRLLSIGILRTNKRSQSGRQTWLKKSKLLSLRERLCWANAKCLGRSALGYSGAGKRVVQIGPQAAEPSGSNTTIPLRSYQAHQRKRK